MVDHVHKAADAVWNRAAMGAGGPNALEGDRSLAALLRLHNETMSGGLLHAVTEGLSDAEYSAALDGYGYFGLVDAAEVISTVRTTATRSNLDDDDLDDLESEADARYHAVVPTDQTLVDAFAQRFEADRSAFASVAT